MYSCDIDYCNCHKIFFVEKQMFQFEVYSLVLLLIINRVLFLLGLTHE